MAAMEPSWKKRKTTHRGAALVPLHPVPLEEGVDQHVATAEEGGQRAEAFVGG